MEPSKTFKLEWWDTSTGLVIPAGDGRITGADLTKNSNGNGDLIFNTPAIASDIALKITITSVKPDAPSATNHDVSFKSSFTLTGTKTSSVTHIFTNGTEIANPTYTATGWSGSVTLNSGANNISVVGKDDSGNSSDAVIVPVNLHTPGDANGDTHINGVDLGMLMSNWDSTDTNTNYKTDFNSDGTVGAVDFSMMMSGWE
jgi:hypothetical protein